MFPEWLRDLAIASLAMGGLSALIIALDELLGHRQKMWIMDVVWPITGLYAGPLALWSYFTVGRFGTRRAMKEAKAHGDENPAMSKPCWQSVGVAATHCGAGCTLGDIAAEWLIFCFPFAIFGMKTYAGWLIDYIFAFSFGIAFQYFTIAPMRALGLREGIAAAVKADALSLTSWQVGMYGWMAIAVFVIFGREIPRDDPIFWFMMQIGMLLGFLTAYPVNWWLLDRGVKEKM